MTEDELFTKVQALGEVSEETRNRIVCALIGHSNIQSHFFGYFYCGRCGDEVGDALGGVYDAGEVVIIGHGCETCHRHYDTLGWEHKVYVPYPFAEPTP